MRGVNRFIICECNREIFFGIYAHTFRIVSLLKSNIKSSVVLNKLFIIQWPRRHQRQQPSSVLLPAIPVGFPQCRQLVALAFGWTPRGARLFPVPQSVAKTVPGSHCTLREQHTRAQRSQGNLSHPMDVLTSRGAGRSTERLNTRCVPHILNFITKSQLLGCSSLKFVMHEVITDLESQLVLVTLYVNWGTAVWCNQLVETYFQECSFPMKFYNNAQTISTKISSHKRQLPLFIGSGKTVCNIDKIYTVV